VVRWSGFRSEKVINPDEPLALRLSSNLMIGIVRVYDQQVRIRSASFVEPDSI
jgi:hypothetical protein